MLQFFYTNTWKCPAGVPDIVVYVCHVHVYAIGEKYGCDKLQEYTLSRFRRLTDDYDGSDEEFMDMVVKAHYEKAAKRDCAMGRAIARFIMRKNAAFLRSGQAADLVKTYPNFARDIFLECHEIGSCSIWQT
jgi:cob(I)alamin adenosyltransferase